MALQFEIVPHILRFTFTAGTSRGSFNEKETWWIKVFDNRNPQVVGWGEASPLKGLSIDYSNDFEHVLRKELLRVTADNFSLSDPQSILSLVHSLVPSSLPSIRFAVETALLDLFHGGRREIFQNDFFNGKMCIPINGLIWMGEPNFMQEQITLKLKEGFDTIKMKIGAIGFDDEIRLLEYIREQYGPNEITLRVDANGAFGEGDVREKLIQLAALNIHSIEQPVAAGQRTLMRQLCKEAILPIALDEELIGVHGLGEKAQLLDQIQPQFIILKPSLLGGILACQEWIELAEERDIGWWFTSMLESNIALNAIAQMTANYAELMPQGLGTGKLYTNNLNAPLTIKKGQLLYNHKSQWGNI